MNSIEIFSSNDFGNVRTIIINNEPWFVGRDVAASLGFKQVVAAVRRKVAPAYKREYTIESNGGSQTVTLINEQGIYALVMNSRLPNAIAFQDWIYREVIPMIRKHGVYVTDEVLEMTIQNPRYIQGILQKYIDEQEKRKQLEYTNAALTEQEMRWDNRAILNALIRAYGAGILKGNMCLAWNMFYKELLYKEHIGVKLRYANQPEAKFMIECIENEEWPRVIKCAVAFCEKKKIDTGEILAHCKDELQLAG